MGYVEGVYIMGKWLDWLVDDGGFAPDTYCKRNYLRWKKVAAMK